MGTGTVGMLRAAAGLPSSRRAAASITHDTAASTGATGPVPDSGNSTDSTTPGAAADGSGVGTITGGATLADSGSVTGAISTGAAGADAVARGTATAAGDTAAAGSATGWPDRACEEADGAGRTVWAAALFCSLDVATSGGRTAEERAARPGKVPTGTSTRSEAPARTGSASAGFSATRVERPARCRDDD